MNNGTTAIAACREQKSHPRAIEKIGTTVAGTESGGLGCSEAQACQDNPPVSAQGADVIDGASRWSARSRRCPHDRAHQHQEQHEGWFQLVFPSWRLTRASGKICCKSARKLRLIEL